MKKLVPILLVVLVLAACHKEPDSSKLDNDFVVLTDHDAEANFSAYTTFYIPDSVLIIGDYPQPRYWTAGQTEQIVSTIETALTSRGYTRINDRNEADLGIQSSYIEDVTYFHGYYDYPYWWWGYPGYWGSGYWGDWGGWYYPYPITYSYRVGSLLTEIVDLKAKAPRRDAGTRLTVLWTAYMQGLLSSSNQYNSELAVRALNQAFTQSPYLQK